MLTPFIQQEEEGTVEPDYTTRSILTKTERRGTSGKGS